MLARAARHADERASEQLAGRDRPARRRPPRTACAIRLEANIELPDDLRRRGTPAPKASGCTDRSSCSPARGAAWADEDAQYRGLPRHARRDGAGPVTVRTFDVDEEQLRALPRSRAEGWEPDEARAAAGPARPAAEPHAPTSCSGCSCARCCAPRAHGPLRIMFPFVSGVEESARRARWSSRRAAERCARAAMPVPRVPIGVMIEIPAAALHRRPARARSRLLHHRHQRSDPVLPGGRSRRRARVAAVRAAAPGDPARDRCMVARGARRGSGFRCRSAARWRRIRRC